MSTSCQKPQTFGITMHQITGTVAAMHTGHPSQQFECKFLFSTFWKRTVLQQRLQMGQSKPVAEDVLGMERMLATSAVKLSRISIRFTSTSTISSSYASVNVTISMTSFRLQKSTAAWYQS
jgi:hypothetical protein